MYYVVDVETDAWSQTQTETFSSNKLKFGCLARYVAGKRVAGWVFHSSTELFELLERETVGVSNVRIFAHNLEFDLRYFFLEFFHAYANKQIQNGQMIDVKFGIETPQKKDPTKLSFRCKYDFRNSLSLLPMKLAEVGTMVSLPKLDQDYADTESADFREYCFRDCDIVALGIEKLCEMFRGWGFENLTVENCNLTIASLSYKLFHIQNRKYDYKDAQNKTRNLLTYLHDSCNDEFRRFYYGGRCEVFDIQMHDNVECYDYNSLYPFVMMFNKFPKPPYIRVKVASLDELDSEKIPRVFAVKCNIDESNELYPLIPERIDSKVVFRACAKTALITIEEYYYLLSRHCIDSIDSIWYCDGWIEPFDYMHRIYQDRLAMKAAKNPADGLCKLPMNCTYGKFAERAEKGLTEMVNIASIPDLLQYLERLRLEEKKYELFEEIGMIMIITKQCFGYQQINLPFAHRITGLARLKLTSDLHRLQDQNIAFHYCDTDSIFLSNPRRLPLPLEVDNSKLGAMKLEHQCAKFQAFSCKEYLYCEDMVETIGGMEIHNALTLSKAKGAISNSFMKDVEKGKCLGDDAIIQRYYEDNITRVKPARLKEIIKSHATDLGQSVLVEKQKRTLFDKRKIYADGSTRPLNGHETPKSIAQDNIQAFMEFTSFRVQRLIQRQPIALTSKWLLPDKVERPATQYRKIREFLIANNLEYLTESMEQIGIDPKLTTEENYHAIVQNAIHST